MLSPKSSLLYSKPDFGDNMRHFHNFGFVAYCHQNPVYYIVDWILVTTCDKSHTTSVLKSVAWWLQFLGFAKVRWKLVPSCDLLDVGIPINIDFTKWGLNWTCFAQLKLYLMFHLLSDDVLKTFLLTNFHGTVHWK